MNTQGKKPVVAIVGPTASGKTALSLPAAKALGGEILCMDSMQVYRGMDIGTAKPTKAERSIVPHHLLDMLDPGDSFSVSQYAEAARACISQVRLPILVGGTGMYLQSLSQPMNYGTVAGDEEIRQKYHALADTQGPQAVHRELNKIDPPTAARLHPNDLRRVIRALEVYELTGVPFSQQKTPDEQDAPYDFRIYALDLPREALYGRVNRRVDEMMDAGLLSEVQRLLDGGLSPEAQSMQGLGYKELAPVILRRAPLSEAVDLIKLRTRHFAKRQLTWFRRDQRIRWLPWQPGQDTAPLIERIIKENQ